jgi:hypothetical protein
MPPLSWMPPENAPAPRATLGTRPLWACGWLLLPGRAASVPQSCNRVRDGFGKPIRRASGVQFLEAAWEMVAS